MKLTLILLTLVISFTASATTMECALFQNNDIEQLIAKVEVPFPENGSVEVTEKNNILNNSEISRYAFLVKVEDGELNFLSLTDKTREISTEHRGFGSHVMKVTLKSKGHESHLDCWLFN